MESPLEVLSRAVTMVQDKATSESKLPNKELPTTKWRRDRRRLSEYQTNSSLNNMTITTTIKTRSPPPYREPLPGSTYALTLATRPSVITVGPKALRDDAACSSAATSSTTIVTSQSATMTGDPQPMIIMSPKTNNNNNSTINTGRSCATTAAPVATTTTAINAAAKPPVPVVTDLISNKTERLTDSISMCDTVIDEHFRRSLGNNYMDLIENGAGGAAKKTAANKAAVIETKSISVSVDDHFAKALGGETWNKLKATNSSSGEDEEVSTRSNHNNIVMAGTTGGRSSCSSSGFSNSSDDETMERSAANRRVVGNRIKRHKAGSSNARRQ